MKQLLTLILLLNLLIAQAQTEEKFNLGFENHDKNESLSDGWFEWGNYELSIELSQSQSEYTAMAFRAGDNTSIIGSTTAGADGNVSAILLPGGLRTMISGIGVYYPNGEETQRVGIIPDVVVKPTIKGIKEGKDELLQKAIELILEK